ncbi:type VII secretion protein EccB [Amycolatopsis sp. NBC_01480]|uniref:type VII secretion protein EccB n=1 Tax=Amycolatopsis sp. NBC_01480 TaxID=2903562 RepID=UPI002E2C59C3|nr:type VII secretion protein EccB [Amycolatopsis sp. NBC_01480]
MTNYASALLALGSHAATTPVSAKSLIGVPRGPRIGIQDAPDALPGPGQVLRDGWTCSVHSVTAALPRCGSRPG